jgi:hypothetical protein
MRQSTVAVAALAFVAGCSSPSTCVPGLSIACACAGLAVGVQTCQSDGTFSLCACGVAAGSSTDMASSGAPPKRLFVTHGTFAGNLGGLAGADSLCGAAAARAGQFGTWKAWLSDSATNAIDRIAGVGPWALVNGVVVFANRTALQGTPAAAPDLDENGTQLGSTEFAWTATSTGGLRQSAQTCGDWASAASSQQGGFGEPAIVNLWTDYMSTFTCSHSGHLYCLEQY